MKLVVSLLLVSLVLSTCAGTYTNAVSGIYSRTSSCDELKLPGSSTFAPIDGLLTAVYITQPARVFVHYQLNLNNTATFMTKLQIDNCDVGSIVRVGTRLYKTMTGFWMGHLNPGYYLFKVLYIGSAAYVPASIEWQAAKIDIMWFTLTTTDVIRDEIKCNPTPTTSNNYDNWGPIKDLAVTVQLPVNTAMLSVYQFSTSSTTKMFASLDINGFQQPSTAFVADGVSKAYVDVHGIWAGKYNDGVHYFNVIYRSPATFHFTDCQLKYRNNENLYVMILPPTCSVININPRSDYEVKNTTWSQTDVCYDLNLTKTRHVIVFYHFTTESGKHHVFNRLTINSDPIKHSASITGNGGHAGNTGLWQGALPPGTFKICLEYTSNVEVATSIKDIPWNTRSMTIVYC